MRTVGIRALKNKLSQYVKIASMGETVLISDRDRVVAELVPPAQSRARLVTDAALAELVRSGLLSPALVVGSVPTSGPPVCTWQQLQDELANDRADR